MGNNWDREGRRGGTNTSRDEAIVVAIQADGQAVNASGYRDQLSRQYGLIGLAGMALTIDNAWLAIGSSISISIFNGGPPSLIFGLIVAATYYTFIGLSLSEVRRSIRTLGLTFTSKSKISKNFTDRWIHLASFFCAYSWGSVPLGNHSRW